MPGAEAAGAVLTIDLAAIVANYRLLADRAAPAVCAAVVKADAYGLGAAPVAAALAQAGCGSFFVATVAEGVSLRATLPREEIFVLNGLAAGGAADCVEHRLQPVLNSLGEIDDWASTARRVGRALPGGIHVDTGMARLGVPGDELAVLAQSPHRLGGIGLTLAMSHLACPDEPDHELNRQQLVRYRAVLERLAAALPTDCRRSLAASSGIFLGTEYCFDMVRPGAALYGIRSLASDPNPMAQVIRLQGRILQVRDVDRGMTVGYGATHRFARPTRLVTVGVGYADGYLRALSNRGSGFIGDRRLGVVGRVSMDLTTLDATDIPAELVRQGALVDLIGPRNPVDDVAAAATTIGYEILTALGSRYERRYLGGGATSDVAD